MAAGMGGELPDRPPVPKKPVRQTKRSWTSRALYESLRRMGLQ